MPEKKAVVDNEPKRGVGLDVGTAFVVGSRQVGEDVELRSIRNAYFSMPPNKIMQDQLTKAAKKDDSEENKYDGGAGYLELNGKIVVIGEKALAYASCTHNETQRPMKQGVLSGDENAEAVMSIIVKKALGEPKFKGEVCRFSVPATPFDNTDIDTVFHEGILTAILSDIGYTPKPLNEGEAVCYSELSSEEDQMTGGAFSFGGGQSNGCVMFEGRPIISFSVSRGGDWIDEKSYKHARMQSASEMTYYKETHDVDLLAPKGREEAALALYYQHHIRSMIDAVAKLFERERSIPAFRRPIKWAVSGGTSLAKNFVELVKREFSKQKLPFEISDVVHSKSPLNATANGCLIAARLDEGS